MTDIAIKTETRIERVNKWLDNFFDATPKKQPSKYWPEDEEINLDELEFICYYKFVAEGLKSMGVRIPREDIYSKCSECSGKATVECTFRPEDYGLSEED